MLVLPLLTGLVQDTPPPATGLATPVTAKDCGLATPVPLRLMMCGLPVALLAMLTAPVLLPTAVGEKVTLMLQLAPAARVAPQVVVLAKSLLTAFDPVNARIFTFALVWIEVRSVHEDPFELI